MLFLRLLVMVLSIICLMDSHSEVASSTTRIRKRGESLAVEPNDTEMEIFERKKKKSKKAKKSKKIKGKKSKSKKPNPTKAVMTTQALTTSTTTTARTTTSTVTPTTISTTTETSSSTTTTTTTTTTMAKTTTIVTTSAPPTTVVTGAGGECKATNGKPCIFPFKDDNKVEYNECKNKGGQYFWCATAVYESGKYKYWSYCPKDGSCPLEGDGECRATNFMPCVFPFKDGKKEYNNCADFGGKYFWCATGTNSAGMYTTWSECPKDGSCPLPEKSTTLAMTSTVTTSSTTPLANERSPLGNVENKLNEIGETLQTLKPADFTADETELLQTMKDLTNYLEESNKGKRNPNYYNPVKINHFSEKLTYGFNKIETTGTISRGYNDAFDLQKNTCFSSADSTKLAQADVGIGRKFYPHTVTRTATPSVSYVSKSSTCCYECQRLSQESQLYEYSNKKCTCYKVKPGYRPQTMYSYGTESAVCSSEDSSTTCEACQSCSNSENDAEKIVRVAPNLLMFPPPAVIPNVYPAAPGHGSVYYDILDALRRYANICQQMRYPAQSFQQRCRQQKAFIAFAPTGGIGFGGGFVHWNAAQVLAYIGNHYDPNIVGGLQTLPGAASGVGMPPNGPLGTGVCYTQFANFQMLTQPHHTETFLLNRFFPEPAPLGLGAVGLYFHFHLAPVLGGAGGPLLAPPNQVVYLYKQRNPCAACSNYLFRRTMDGHFALGLHLGFSEWYGRNGLGHFNRCSLVRRNFCITIEGLKRPFTMPTFTKLLMQRRYGAHGCNPRDSLWTVATLQATTGIPTITC